MGILEIDLKSYLLLNMGFKIKSGLSPLILLDAVILMGICRGSERNIIIFALWIKFWKNLSIPLQYRGKSLILECPHIVTLGLKELDDLKAVIEFFREKGYDEIILWGNCKII